MKSESDVRFLDAAMWDGRVFSGAWVSAAGGTGDVIEPATGSRLYAVGMANSEDVANAAQQAAKAQVDWAATDPQQRASIFLKAATIFDENSQEIARFIARETGSIVPKGLHEVRSAINLLRQAAAQVMHSTGILLPSVPGRQSYARRVPHGVVGVISPFNFPLILSLRSVAPALAAGNAVVIKPDPQTPVTGGFIIARVLQEAGLPEGVLHVLPGGANAGEALVTHPLVRMIAFTGSTAAGRRVGELAGKHLKKVALELGGKNSLIVLEDADIDIAVNNAAFGVYFHQGQICMATGRVLVQESIADDFTRRLVAKASGMAVGDPMGGNVALGPLINQRQRDRVHEIVQASVQAGAKLETGGTYDKLFYRPTVLSGVKPGMAAFTEEVFGPVASVIRFDTDDQAVALANDTEYGLSAAVISASTVRALAIGTRLNTGLLHINDQTVADEGINPFGGRGASGNGGSMGGPADLDEYTQWQWVTIKDKPLAKPF